MKKIQMIFNRFRQQIVVLCSLFLFLVPITAHALDESIDCAGRPRWDRFVIDENSDNWDPDSANCFGMPPVDSAKLYGSPKMYGEFENISVPPVVKAKVAPETKAKPMMVAKKPRPKAKPKSAPKPKPVVMAQKLKQESKPKTKVVEPVLPDSKATAIAGALKDGWIDMESFCTSVNPPVKGPMPAGIVLMPGRPDLMCCVTKN